MPRGRFSNLTKCLGRRSGLLVFVAALALGVTAIALAAGNTAIPAPTISSAPANPTNQTSAKFTYSDSQAGVAFQCQLDGSGYTSCPASGITYAGPLAAGSHAFKVQAVSGNKTSPAASYTWTVDTTSPTIAMSFPKNESLYGVTSWDAGCSGEGGFCGSAKDPSGVNSVLISVRQGNGNWWGGSGFNKTTEFFVAATLASPEAGSSAWKYPFGFPAGGTYTVHVRASDAAGNLTPASSQLSATFTVKPPPPTPVISSGPEEQTTSTTATFVFADSEEGVSLLCKLDGGSFAKCASPKSYSGLGEGVHTFYVEAKDSAGNVSSASYSWTVEAGKKAFTIEGNLPAAVAPGVSQPLPLKISNPNSVAIYVTSLLVSVHSGSTKAGCDGPTNLQVTQANPTSKNPLTVPARGQVTLPSGGINAPQVLMLNLATNQDACKGASFTFNYSGSAHS